MQIFEFGGAICDIREICASVHMLDSVSFFRVIKTGFVNFWRNLWLSAAATMVVVITLVIFCVLALLFGVTKYSVEAIKDRVDVSVYFKAGTPETRINELRQELRDNPKIRGVEYVSAEQALIHFKAKHVNDPLILESLVELADNPLPATIQIKAAALEDYPELARQLNEGPFKNDISKVNFEDNRLLIERLGKVLRIIVSTGIVLVSVFSLIAVLVIFNTITLTIYNRREEVEIMRLVGATNWYIRGPFIIEATLYSLVAAAITTALVAALFTKMVPVATEFLTGTAAAGLLQSRFFSIPVVGSILLIIALTLSIFSSSLAIRRYLKV